jgi:hypothetical protein
LHDRRNSSAAGVGWYSRAPAAGQPPALDDARLLEFAQPLSEQRPHDAWDALADIPLNRCAPASNLCRIKGVQRWAKGSQATAMGQNCP